MLVDPNNKKIMDIDKTDPQVRAGQGDVMQRVAPNVLRFRLEFRVVAQKPG